MPDWHVHHFDEISSTQDEASDRAREGSPEGTVIIADIQTAGRGRIGNHWQSPRGNMMASIVLRPQIEPAQSGQYSFLMAIALNRTLSEMINDTYAVMNKWPNDVLVDDKKIAGILLESVLSGQNLNALIIGVGVNVATAPPDRICLNDLGAGHETARTVLDAFLATLNEVLTEYDREGFLGLREEWLDHAINLHKSIKVRLPSGSLDGIFEGLEPDGALRLRLANDEIKVIHSGEVFFG